MCGIGEPGEIAIRTPFSTLGYINAPDKNRERFVKNRVRDDEQDLLYLTGDLGRYRPDGTLMMEGRLDDQVKINGVRVSRVKPARSSLSTKRWKRALSWRTRMIEARIF